ncbi:hypothetical protein JCM3775_000089 [Rhodotorula graminis]
MATKLDPTAASFHPSVAEPLELVTPLLADDDKPPASFGHLPVELKDQIVAEVINLDRDRKQETRAAFVASVTVGFFARRKVIKLELWRHIDAEKVRPEAFPRLLDVLPEHAASVRRLETVGSFLEHRASPEERALYLETNQCLGRVVHLCENLEQLHLGNPQLNPLLPFHFPRLRILSIHSPHSFWRKPHVSEHETFLVGLSGLTSLDLYVDGTALYKCEALKVVDVLIGLPGLKNLKLRGDAVLRDEVLEACTEVAPSALPALESLEIVQDGNLLGFGTLHAFVTTFAASLKELHLNVFPDSGDSSDDDSDFDVEYRLPHLTALSLATGCDEGLFPAFSSPSTPIVHFTFGIPVDREHYGLVRTFLGSHASTLKTLYLSKSSVQSGPRMCDMVKTFCESLGIEVACAGEEEKLVGVGAQGRRA